MSIRTEWVDTCYDFWLDFYGTPWKARRQLRGELKANLAEASAEVGWEKARDGLGAIRLLAKESAEAVRDPRRPAWSSGFGAAALAFATIMLLGMFASMAFVDGALAAGLAENRTATGAIRLMPGMTASADGGSTGLVFGMQFSPWLVLGVPTLCFLLASRIWRLFGRR
ncbi:MULTISPECIES: hypothetical protein [unclassified Luteococcus]|uniref:hypothetical protein n=1 Tax=unclassified Luteococcus TaxID=2639923 RepID=UPI00313AC588